MLASALEYIWQNWFIMALLVPFFVAIVNILDIYFVQSIYEDEWDGVLISGLFQLTPWLLVLSGLIEFHSPSLFPFLLALFAGGFLMVSFYFYFRVLFSSNDMVSVQVMSALSILLVPFLSWFMFGATLSPVHYFGILLAALGTLILSIAKKNESHQLRSFFYYIIIAVFFLSLSMVLQEQTYRLIGHDFWTGFLLFTCGGFFMSLGLLLFDKRPFMKRLAHIIHVSRNNLLVFAVAESISIFGILASQRAIDLSPSVSFVIVIESLLPIFILLMSGILVLVFLFLDRKKAQQMYRDQFSFFWIKICASVVIVAGIYLVT